MPTIDEAAQEILNGQSSNTQSPSNSESQSIDDAANEILGSQQQAPQAQSQNTGSFGQKTYNIDSVEDKSSGSNFLERLYLGAFADEDGKEKYLKERYAVVQKGPDGDFYFGNSIKDLRPFDPDGIANDVLGEAADLLSQAPQIGASIIGGAMGAVGGPAGAIAGAAGASGAAELGMKGIGKTLGLNTQNPVEVGTDVLISSIAGGAGEGLGQFLKAASSKDVARKGFKLIEDKLIKTPFAPEKQKSAKFIAKMFNITSGVPEEKTLNVFKYGADEVFAKDSGTSEGLLKLIDDFSETVTTQERNLGTSLGASEKHLLMEAKNYKVPTQDIQKNVLGALNELGLIDENGLVTTRPISGGSEQSVLIKTFEKLNLGAREVSAGRPTFDSAGNLIRQEKIPVLSINPKATIDTKELFSIRQQLQSVKESTKSNNFKRIIGDILHGNEQSGKVGIANEVSKIASQFGDEAYLATRKTFANYKSILDSLESYGLNPKTNKLSIENITKGSTEMAQVLRREMSKLDSFNKSQFLKKMDIWDTSQAFANSNPNFLRFNTVASLLGLGALAGGRTPGEKAIGFTGALALGTPIGVKFALKGMRAGNKQVVKSTGQQTANIVLKKLLSSRLATQTASKSTQLSLVPKKTHYDKNNS